MPFGVGVPPPNIVLRGSIHSIRPYSINRSHTPLRGMAVYSNRMYYMVQVVLSFKKEEYQKSGGSEAANRLIFALERTYSLLLSSKSSRYRQTIDTPL